MNNAVKAHYKRIASMGGKKRWENKDAESKRSHGSYMVKMRWFKQKGGKIYKSLQEYKEQNEVRDIYKPEMIENTIKKYGYYAEDKDKNFKII